MKYGKKQRCGKESPPFKVWCHDEHGWVQNNFDDYVELNWAMPGNPDEQLCFVDVKAGINAEIVMSDEDGEFRRP